MGYLLKAPLPPGHQSGERFVTRLESGESIAVPLLHQVWLLVLVLTVMWKEHRSNGCPHHLIALIIKVCARVQLLVSTLWTSFTKVVDHIIMIIINILWTSFTKVLTTLASTTTHSSGEVVVATIRFFNFD